MILFLFGLSVGILARHFIPIAFTYFVYSGIEGGKRKAIQKGIETVIENQN